ERAVLCTVQVVGDSSAGPIEMVHGALRDIRAFPLTKKLSSLALEVNGARRVPGRPLLRPGSGGAAPPAPTLLHQRPGRAERARAKAAAQDPGDAAAAGLVRSRRAPHPRLRPVPRVGGAAASEGRVAGAGARRAWGGRAGGLRRTGPAVSAA